MDDLGEPIETTRLKSLVAIAIFVAIVLLWWTGTLAKVVQPESIRDLVNRAGSAAPLAFVVLLIPLNAVFLAGAPIWISSTLFPLHLAIVYSIAGAVVASAAVHGLARYFGRDWARARIPSRLHASRDRLEKNPLRAVATMRVLLWINPGVDLLTAVARVRPRDYLVGTLVGIAAPTAARVYIGQRGIEAAADSPAWFWTAVAVAVLAILGVRYFRRSSRIPSPAPG